MAQGLPLAFRQLSFEKMKLLAAVGGVTVAVMLMWVQLGILGAFNQSGTLVHKSIRADLVVLHPHTDSIGRVQPFSSRSLYRMSGFEEVADIGELLVGPVEWRHPIDGTRMMIQCWGVDPDAGWVDLPGLKDHAVSLRDADTFLFDQRSRPVFGKVTTQAQGTGGLMVELNRRTCEAVGLTTMAASFGQQGNILCNRANYLRLHGQQSADQVQIGFIRLRPGTQIEAIKARMAVKLAPEAIIMTPHEFIELELKFFKANAPVGFIFTMGTVVGFLIGFIVVYQILYTDVANNLKHYATMKAMGFTNGYLLRLVIRQGFILSILGYIPGSLLAISFYKIVQWGTSIPVAPTFERAVMLFFITILMCFLSSVLATRKLRAADPADVF